MTVYTSPGLVVAPAFDYEPHHPLVLWNTLVIRTNIAADSADPSYPVSNLANPNTNLRWQSGSTAGQQITISDLDGQIDSIAIARHNFGSGAVEVTEIEGITAEPGAVWQSLFGPQQLPDDTPALFRFAKGYYVGIRLTLTPTSLVPQCAVLFCGEIMAIRPGIVPGFTPLGAALSIDVYNGRSERGEHLGSIVSGAELATSLSFKDIDADVFEDEVMPFLAAANLGSPFFFAWSADTSPADVSFAWLASTCLPVINRTTGEIDMTLDLKGLSL